VSAPWTIAGQGGLSGDWQPGPARPSLGEGEIHLWCLRWTAFAGELAQLERELSPEEHQRASRFRFDKDRARYLVGRACLRRLLSRYTGIEPRQINFRYGPRGKPYLASDHGLEFNMSDAGELIAYAFRLIEPVGVDIERIRPDVPGEGIAQRYFHPREAEALAQLPAELRVQAFFRCWTRKEAFVKAIGEGIRFGLHRFAVPVEPGSGVLLETPFPDDQPERWRIFEFTPGEGYMGAVVSPVPVANIRLWQLEPGQEPGSRTSA